MQQRRSERQRVRAAACLFGLEHTTKRWFSTNSSGTLPNTQQQQFTTAACGHVNTCDCSGTLDDITRHHEVLQTNHNDTLNLVHPCFCSCGAS